MVISPPRTSSGTDAGDAVTPEILTTGICNEFICAPPSACRAISSTCADVGVVQELAALSGTDAGDAVTPEILTIGICTTTTSAHSSARRVISSRRADVGVVQDALSGARCVVRNRRGRRGDTGDSDHWNLRHVHVRASEKGCQASGFRRVNERKEAYLT